MTGAPLEDCRQKTLKCINCRPFLIAICALVVVECACVLAELMIDLQGIKFRFENEETEINKFVSYLRRRYPDVFRNEDMRTMADIINMLERSIVLRNPNDLLLCNSRYACVCPCNETALKEETNIKTTTSDSSALHFQSFLQPQQNGTYDWVPTPRLEDIHVPLGNKTLTEPMAFSNVSDPFNHSSLLSQSTSFVLSSSESEIPYSSFMMWSKSPDHESQFSIMLTSSQSSTPDLEPTEIYYNSISLNEPNLDQRFVSEWPVQTYNLNLKPLDLSIIPLMSSRMTQQKTGISPVTDKIPVPLQKIYPVTFYMSTGDAFDRVANSDVQTLLVMASLLPQTEFAASISAEEYTSISASSVQGIETRTPSTAAVADNHLPTLTETNDTSFARITVSTLPASVVQNTDNLTDKTAISEFPSVNISNSRRFVYLLSNATNIMNKTKPLAASKTTETRPLIRVKDTIYLNETKMSDHSTKLDSTLGSGINFSSASFVNETVHAERHSVMPLFSVQEKSGTSNISLVQKPVNLQDIFILEVNNVIDSFFLVAEFVPEHNSFNRTKFIQNTLEYSKIYKASKVLHFISLSILSVMVLETAVKLFCTGCAFFKRKFEVFDAFIVVSSFALDFVFLDSRWYETGKDATTILVLLLPWRVVRIVNSFLMTMKHKHHLQMMNMKRAKKKAELKSAKLQTLLSEIRKDVQLLVSLCRSNEIEEKDITACLYGKGRRSVTMSAMSTCTSLMLISTLGKDAVQEDEIYGKHEAFVITELETCCRAQTKEFYNHGINNVRVFKEAFNDGDMAELDEEILQAEEAAIDAAIELDEQLEARRKSRKYKSKKVRVKRSYTVPRRSASLEIPEPSTHENTNNTFYINDGYANTRGSSPLSNDIGMLGAGPNFPKIGSAATAGCSSLKEVEELHKEDSPSFRISTDVQQVTAPSKYKSIASIKSLPGKDNRSNSVVVYLPELDEEFEIPIESQRKQRSSFHLNNI